MLLMSAMNVTMTTAAMARNPPPTPSAAARARELPLRMRLRTNGSSVAARIVASSTGISTSGIAAKMPTTSPPSATATRARQLNCASRSSQLGTRAGSSGCGPGSRIATAALATAKTMAITGTAANSPTTPASSNPAGRATRTSAGWRLTVRPYTWGRTP